MLQFNELRITPDGKYLVIDTEVQSLPYYQDVYIKAIYITVYKNASDCDPLNDKGKKIYIWKDSSVVADENEQYLETGNKGEKYKNVRKVIDIDLIKDNLLFVTVLSEGEAAEDTPCGVRNEMITGIAYNKDLLYRNSIGLLNTMDGCTPNNSLIDYILQTEVFRLALESGDYKTAVDYWNKMFKKQLPNKKHGCGCNGYK